MNSFVERPNLFIELSVNFSLSCVRLVIIQGCLVKFSPQFSVNSHYSLCRRTTFTLCQQISVLEKADCHCLPTHVPVHRKYIPQAWAAQQNAAH